MAARVRLEKKGLTIPCPELVSGYMAVNLLTNVTEALEGFPLTAERKQRVCFAVRLQPDSCLLLGFVTQSGNYRVPRKFQPFHCPEGITPKGVFR